MRKMKRQRREERELCRRRWDKEARRGGYRTM
jgi:hypothetical protein